MHHHISFGVECVCNMKHKDLRITHSIVEAFKRGIYYYYTFKQQQQMKI